MSRSILPISIPIGSIKSCKIEIRKFNAETFQFQSVRLKDAKRKKPSRETSLFQFQSVRLKVSNFGAIDLGGG